MPDNSTNNNPEGDTPEITLETVVEVAPEELSDEQKNFLQEHQEELDDTQKETYKEVLEKKEEEEIDLEKVEVETRGGKKKEEAGGKGKGEDEEGEDEEIDPDDEKTIGKVVKKQLSGVTAQLEKVQKLTDEAEVTAFIQAKPEYGQYRGVILKYLAHPDYKNIPVHNIAAIVAAKDLQKIGAQKERKAAQKAKDTQGGGSTARKVGGKIDWYTASKEDFERKKSEVLGQTGS